MSYEVYLAKFLDPNTEPHTTPHHAIFVKTEEAGRNTGFKYHVIGSTQAGMRHEHRCSPALEQDPMCIGSDLIGRVSETNYPLLRQICNMVPPPPKQDGGGKIDPQRSVYDTRGWTKDVIVGLEWAGVLERKQSKTKDGQK